MKGLTSRWRLLRRRTARLLGSDDPPEELARGAGLGMFIAMTPTIGMQIPTVTLCWFALRHRWRFHLPLALACTLVTNVLTMPPLFYLYVVTGRVLLGRFDKLKGFDVFRARLEEATSTETSAWDQFFQIATNVTDEFGAPLLVGSLPWCVISAVAVYAMVLMFARRRALQRGIGAGKPRG